MTLLEAIQVRHSVRQYTDQKIDGEILLQLHKIIEECNQESGLNIQLCLDEPKAFQSRLARYGKFSNVRNYLALVGKNNSSLDEKCGYYGEKIVLRATQLGLSTCWVGLTYSKQNIVSVKPDEKLLLVIAIGYGETTGLPHNNKPIEKLCRVAGSMPDWFRRGLEAAQLAPTALNQQKFRFELKDNIVNATAGFGFYAKVDLGIVKYHFELGANESDWKWA